MRRWIAVICASLFVVLRSGEASANGRYPEANRVYLSPTDPNEIIVRASFGLLISRDAGSTFDWVCEEAIGVSGVEDPMYGYLKDGSLVASTFQGIIVSRDRACSWPVAASVGPRVFIDLTQRSAERERVLALESSYDKQDADGGIAFKNQVWESVDDALTFNTLGPALDPSLLGYTIDVAPSDPVRLYISATRNPTTTPSGALLVSRDRGSNWEELPITLEGTERAPYIAAVDPANADRIYVRTVNSVAKPARLLLSDDAGKTFRTIFRSQAELRGFALSPDGSKVYVGGPNDGLHVASTADFAFRKTSSVEVQCITATSDRLWVCSNETSGFIVGRSSDEGASFEGKIHFGDIRGPLDCPQTPPFDQCILGWSSLKATLGFVSDAGADSGPISLPAAPAAGPSDDSSGCGCRASSTTAATGGLFALISVAALLLRRRRS